MSGPRLNMPCIDLSTDRLRFYRQIGTEEVTLQMARGVGEDFTSRVHDRPVRPLVPPAQKSAAGGPGQMWDEGELRAMVARCKAFGLEATTMNLGLSGAILNGQPQREQDIAVVTANIRTAGRVGLRVLTWNFTALRASEGYGAKLYAGRGRSSLRDFDSRRLSTEPLADCPACTHDDMWERLQWTLDQIVPVAEDSGVRLALHPTDPPVSIYRGVSRESHSSARTSFDCRTRASQFLMQSATPFESAHHEQRFASILTKSSDSFRCMTAQRTLSLWTQASQQSGAGSRLRR